MSRPARPALFFVAVLAAGAFGTASIGAFGAASSGSANPVFQVTYAGGMINVTANGTPVGIDGAPAAVIPPGTYDINLVDKEGSPSFQLSGPGVNVLLNQSPAAVTVTFQPGATYYYQDQNDENATYRAFVAQGQGVAVATPRLPGASVGNSSVIGSASTVRVLGTLNGTLTAAGGLSLTDRGKPVVKLTSGRYKLVVSDTSAKAGFTLRETGKRAVTVTTAAFVGKHTVTLVLAAGHWSFSALGAPKSFVVVKA